MSKKARRLQKKMSVTKNDLWLLLIVVVAPLCSVVKNETGGITVIQLQASDLNPLTAQVLLTASPSRPAAPPAGHDTQPPPANKPRRTGSLALFFRKVRKIQEKLIIASVRLIIKNVTFGYLKRIPSSL